MSFLNKVCAKYQIGASIATLLDKMEQNLENKKIKDIIIDDENHYETVWSYMDDDDGEEKPTSGKKWNEALKAYIDYAFNDFYYKFNKIAKLKNNLLYIYREISVDDIDEFIKALQQGKTIGGHKGIGVFWAWDKDRANAHWSQGKHDLMLTGLVDINDINYLSTIGKNLQPNIGSEEAEIEVNKNAYIKILYVEHKGKVILDLAKKPIKIHANKEIDKQRAKKIARGIPIEVYHD